MTAKVAISAKSRYLAVASIVAAVAGMWLALATPVRPSRDVEAVGAFGAEVRSATPPEVGLEQPGRRTNRAGRRALVDESQLATQPAFEVAQLDTFEAGFRARLEADPGFAAYTACLASGERCESIFSTLVNSVLYGSVLADIDANVFKLPAKGTSAAKHAAAELVEVAASTHDAVKRTTALVLLNRVESLSVRELPASAYEGLSSLSLVEQQLLLERHALAPLPSAEVAAEVAALGRMTNDSRALSSAVLALGHPSSDSDLAGLLEDIGVESETRRELTRILSICAGECPRTIRYLLETGQPADRAVLARALDYCPASKVESLREAVREISLGKFILPLPHS